MRTFEFLGSRGDLSAARTGLLVQTGSPALLDNVTRVIRERFPELRLTVLRQREMGDRVETQPGVEYLDNEGSKSTLVRRLRAEGFDVVFVLYSNEGGFWKLKLLPYLTGASSVIAYNENLDSFPVSLRTSRRVVQHLRWRMESSVSQAPGSPSFFGSNVARALLYPGVLAYLVGYERVANAARRTSGRGDGWKQS